MKIEYHLQENVNGVKYKLDVFSEDSEEFTVRENDKKEVYYHTREEFLEDFPELESWFWREED